MARSSHRKSTLSSERCEHAEAYREREEGKERTHIVTVKNEAVEAIARIELRVHDGWSGGTQRSSEERTSEEGNPDFVLKPQSRTKSGAAKSVLCRMLETGDRRAG